MSKEYTIAYLAMQMQSFDYDLQTHDGYDLPVSIAMSLGKAFEEITEHWDWTECDLSWANTIDELVVDAINIVRSKNYKFNANSVVTDFLTKRHPKKFLKKYHYNIPTTNNLYGGFDDGIIEATDENHAREVATKLINEGFEKINDLLRNNNLPTFGYDLDELSINLEK